MPTDPPTVNPSNAAPHGKAVPPPAHPSQQPHHRSLPQQQQRHLRFPQQHHSLLQPPNPIPLSHHTQPQHIPRQYAALSSARNISPMQQQGLSQPPHQIPPQQPQQQQARQHPRPNLNPHQQPPQQPYYVNGGYPGLSAYPPQVAAQYGLSPNYVFTPQAPYYNGMQPQGPPQQPGPHNPRSQRPYSRNIPPQAASHQPQSRVTLPPPKKQILAIVDPDTNEEVKVDSVDKKQPVRTPPVPVSKTAVKIPPRTSRPLELVTDPADAIPKQGAADKVPNTAPLQVLTKQSTSDKSKDLVSENKQDPIASAEAASPVESSEKTPSTKSGTSVSTARESTSDKPAQLNSSIPVKSIVSTSSTDVKSPNDRGVSRPVVASVSTPSNMPEPTKEVEKKSPPGPAAEISTKSSPSAASGASKQISSPTVVASEPVKPVDSVSRLGVSELQSATSAENETAAARSTGPPPQHPASPPGAQGVENQEDASVEADKDSESETTAGLPSYIFGEGERRVYPPGFTHALQEMVTPERDAFYRNILSNRNILKGGAPPAGGDSYGRGGQQRRGNSASSNEGRWARNPQPQKSTTSRFSVSRGAPAPVVGSGVGSYDPFDLRSARSQNPPPAPKAQPTQGRGNQDPRGSHMRMDGPTRGGHGPIDPFVPVAPPVEKLKRSENGWKRNKESDDVVTSKVKQIRSLLNKLTLEKFDKIFKQIIDINISSYEILTGVVREVFEKALFEPKFSGMYAELCVRLDLATREMLQQASIVDDRGRPIFFRNILLNNCRDEFIRFAKSSESTEKDKQTEEDDPAKEDKTDSATEEASVEEAKKPLTPKEKAAKEKAAAGKAAANATTAKRRMLANVRFIGELFLKDLLREQIIHKQCIQRLLKIGIESREEDVLEALCKLLSKTGAKLSQNKDAIQHIDNYFKPLQTMSRDHTLPARVRFMLQDLLEQRQNNWKVRREEVGAKTISEIHKDIEKEERAKAEAQAAARERRGRGGGMHSRHRGPPPFSHVTMTMADMKKSGGSVSRSAAILEKHGGMPSSRKLSTMNAASLRPGGSRPSYGAFGPLGESRDGSSGMRSGDARRNMSNDKRVASSRRPAPVKPAAPVEQKPKIMEPEVLKRKARSIALEYWSIGLIKEAQECIVEEVKPVNYAKFLREIIKFSLSAKVQDRLKSISLLVGLLGDTISETLFISAFSDVVAELSDIEMDDPRASEFLAKYVAAIACSGKLSAQKSDVFGLDFLKKALPSIGDAKRESKFVICIFADIYEHLSKTIADEEQNKNAIRNALTALDVDLSARMYSWNAQIGMKSLDSMLKDAGISFVVPLLPMQLRLKETLETSPSASALEKVFNSSEQPKDDLRSPSFMKMVIRTSFDWLFMKPPSSVKDVFGEVVGKPLVQSFNGEIPRDVQMAALLETQSFIVRNLDILPAHKEGDYDKPGSIVFDSLYFADVVEEDTFLGWREDTDESTRVEGKDKMIMQTSAFFRWLETAEEE
ncbi:Translation initiation factor eIF4, subunit G [Chondrus crispus]|uniref:Eukaryotic translation initiation factor 4 gamma 2 n=1 Tax=Chondrus crispus TaxID=2769 RepID=R7QK53_CHOCR|nr:Translation initiation factor eIF4, subunit G [Chondrus crispus]CDF38449.1 Translation initiation factor eIF4, subunit G [Chondrus crispus]|eukprot:XP_005718342.1 Translation initiation factor eIF4, subunit G [Chondrus crispus]